MIKHLFYLILFSSLGICSCKEEPGTADFYSYTIAIELVNSYGEDLLNPETEGAYLEEDINLYRRVNETLELIYYEKSDYPKHFFLIPSDPVILTMAVNRDVINGSSTTYLQLSPNDMDTIYCEFASGKGYQVVTDVWYNGISLVSKDTTNHEPIFQILKK